MPRGDNTLPGNDYVLTRYFRGWWLDNMRGGNLSNEIAPTIGFRFERVIKTEEGKLNKAAKGFMEQINSIDANIVVVTTGPTRKAQAFLYKWNVPYFKVVEADSPLEIPDIAREGDFVTYYDLEREVLQNVNSRGNKKVKGELWTRVEVS